MKGFLSIWLLLLFCQNVFGQTELKGTVMKNSGEPVTRINVLVYPQGKNALVAFGISDEKGFFEIKVNVPADSLKVEVTSLQYGNETKIIANTSQRLEFKLSPEAKEIEGVTVKARPITKRGDTLSYLVSKFSKNEDRSIEDVLRRMPGIEVEEGGRILYQGVAIKDFYVEELDLMDGRYAVISKNLPDNSVSTVEVFENHQPVKILEERVSSNQASLNLKLKKKVTTTGTVKAGAGASPFLRDVNVTPMTFTKNFQVLTSYQTNNTGKDVARQLKTYTLEEILRNAERPADNPQKLNIRSASPPDIKEARYLDNDIHLANINGLQRLSRDYQLRANFYYIHDIQQQQSALQRKIFTPSDTLEFREDLNNSIYKEFLHGEISLSKNVKNNYLKNKLKIQSRSDRRKGVAQQGGETIQQKLHNPYESVSNELRSINPVGEHLVEFTSYLSYDKSPHNLKVKPGPFEKVITNGENYDKVQQNLTLERFFAHHTAGFSLGWKRFTFSPRIGFSYNINNLTSELFPVQQNEEMNASSDLRNKLENEEMKAFTEAEIEYQRQKLTLKATIPLSWQRVTLNKKILHEKDQMNILVLTPKLIADYEFKNFWRIRGVWNYNKKVENAQDVYNGYILTSYVNLRKNNTPLSKSSRTNLSLYLAYRNPITSFFNKLTGIYAISDHNFVYDNKIHTDGTTILRALQIPNKSYTHSLNAYSSKYFSEAKTTVSVRATMMQRKGKSLLNNELFNTTTRMTHLKPSIDYKLTTWMNTEYELNGMFIETLVDKNSTSSIELWKHFFHLFAFPSDYHELSLTTEYYRLQNKNNLFMDVEYRYTIPDKEIDISLRWSNIFNNEQYISYSANDFTIWESTYLLRPSEIFLAVKFGF